MLVYAIFKAAMFLIIAYVLWGLIDVIRGVFEAEPEERLPFLVSRGLSKLLVAIGGVCVLFLLP